MRDDQSNKLEYIESQVDSICRHAENCEKMPLWYNIVMKKIEKWQKQYETVDKTKVGYSDVRLWPCYMIFSSLILFLSPLLGGFWAFMTVAFPAFYIALKVAKIQNSNPEALARYCQGINDMYAAIEEKDRLAALNTSTPIKTNQTKEIDTSGFKQGISTVKAYA